MTYKNNIKLLLTSFLIAVSGSAFASESARSFSDKAAVLNFEIEGVSLSTPIEKVADIMTNQSWTQVDAPTPPGVETVSFVKGSDSTSLRMARNSRAGEQGYLFIFTKSNDRAGGDGFSITISLKKLAPADYKSFVTPTPAEMVHKYAAALKKTVCDGIQDKDEQWNVCPPNTPEEIFLGPTRPSNFGNATGIQLQPFEIPGHLIVGVLSSVNDANIVLMHQNYKR